jgi:hypothetical protein
MGRGTRASVWQAGLGLDRYDYGLVPLRQVMEFPSQLIGYSVMVIVLQSIDDCRDARKRWLSLRPRFRIETDQLLSRTARIAR